MYIRPTTSSLFLFLIIPWKSKVFYPGGCAEFFV